ncbi:hypothetical protein GF336_04325 [Candidatus Woesearchaeota archaeon]|nr:hypothetical protein [Candidatus Woesearchaeota archaeon]
MKNKLMIAGILMIAVLMTGCAVSDYIAGNVEEDKPYSLLTEKDEDESEDELDELIEELEQETEEATDKLEKETSEEVEETEEVVEETEEVVEETAEEVVEEVAEEVVEEVAEDLKADITIDVKEGEKVSLKPKAKDLDEDDITYTFTSPLDEDGRWQTDYGDAGEYLVTVTATDGKAETSKDVLLVVEKVNVAPEIENIKSVSLDEGETLVLEPVIADPNGDEVTVTISDPVGNDGIWETGYTDNGEYDIIIKATDEELESEQTVKVTINKKNVAPKIEGVEEFIEIQEGDTLVLEPEVTDLNEDDVTVTISDPVGNDGTWETDYTDHGEYTVTIKAEDEESTTTLEVTVIVEDINKAPEIIDIVQEE